MIKHDTTHQNTQEFIQVLEGAATAPKHLNILKWILNGFEKRIDVCICPARRLKRRQMPCLPKACAKGFWNPPQSPLSLQVPAAHLQSARPSVAVSQVCPRPWMLPDLPDASRPGGVDLRVIKMANEIKFNLVSLLTNESKRCNMEAPTQASLPSGNPRSTSYLINRPPTSRNCLIVKHATRADRTVSCNKSWNKAGVIPRETSFSHCLHIRPEP